MLPRRTRRTRYGPVACNRRPTESPGRAVPQSGRGWASVLIPRPGGQADAAEDSAMTLFEPLDWHGLPADAHLTADVAKVRLDRWYQLDNLDRPRTAGEDLERQSVRYLALDGIFSLFAAHHQDRATRTAARRLHEDLSLR